MKIYSYTENEFTENLNIGKDVLAHDLFKAGVINEEQCRTIQEDYAIMLAPSSLFGTKIKKAMGWDDDKSYFKTIKLNFDNKNNKETEDVHQSEDSDTAGVDNGSD